MPDRKRIDAAIVEMRAAVDEVDRRGDEKSAHWIFPISLKLQYLASPRIT